MASVVLNVSVSLLLAALSTVALVGLLLSQISVARSAFFQTCEWIDWLMVHSVDPSLGSVLLLYDSLNTQVGSHFFTFFIICPWSCS